MQERLFAEPPDYLDELARRAIGAAIEVHRHLGAGYLEAIYEEALVIECELRGLAVRRQSEFSVGYKGRTVGTARIDLLVENELVLELKSVEHLHPVHVAQMMSYLKAGGFQLGLLINFNVDFLRNGIRRVIWNP